MEIIATKPERLVNFLQNNIKGLTYSTAQKLVRIGKVKVNKLRCKENVLLNAGDIVFTIDITPSFPAVSIVYEDENLIIANKPSGIETTEKDKSSKNSFSLEEIFENKNATPVHRLDRLTEGLVILAKNPIFSEKLMLAIKNREIEKRYLALVYGSFLGSEIKEAYLKKDEKLGYVSISKTEKPGYKKIITEFTPKQHFIDTTLVEVKLHTGRTHQIRAHLAHLNHEIVGDTKYSSKKHELMKKYKGYFLCAFKLNFNFSDPALLYLNELSFEIEPSFLKLL